MAGLIRGTMACESMVRRRWPRIGRQERAMKCNSFQPSGGVSLFALLAMLVITLVLGTLTIPLAADAQQPAKVARIVCLSVTIGPGSAQAEAFRQGLRELGYVEGHNIALEFRAAGETDRLPALAAELVQLPVDVLVALGGQAAQGLSRGVHKVPLPRYVPFFGEMC